MFTAGSPQDFQEKWFKEKEKKNQLNLISQESPKVMLSKAEALPPHNC